MVKVRLPQIRGTQVPQDPAALSEFEAGLITASKIKLPVGRLSPSQIDMYLRCPQQYYRRYVLGEKTPPGVALVEGGSHHKACEVNNLHKIKKGDDLPEKAVFEAFADSFSQKQKEVEDWEGETPDAVVQRGKAIVRAHMTEFAPKFRPVRSEFEVTAVVGPVTVLGIVDAAGGVSNLKKERAALIDYKTVARSKSEAELASSLQLSFYAYEEHERTGSDDFDVGYVNLLKSGKCNPQFIAYDVTRARWFRAVAISVANAISLGSFPMAQPDHWCCSARFCGYWNKCRGSVR